MLTLLILQPLLVMLWLLGAANHAPLWRVSFMSSLLTLFMSFYSLWRFTLDAGHNVPFAYQDVQAFGMRYSVGLDGLNVLFLPLSASLSVFVLLYVGLTRHAHDKYFLAAVLGYETILLGAFTALNGMQFWFWTVLEVLPMMMLTVRTGTGAQRATAATRVAQYWGGGLVMTLAGFLLLGFGLMGNDHPLTFDWQTLRTNNAYLHDEILIFILLFFGYALRLPLFPFHGWLPLLAQQGTVASTLVFILGAKLSIYALLRFVLPIVPGVAEQWAGFVVTLSLFSLLYGAFAAALQINLRRLLAFISVSQSGVLMIGLFSFNDLGLQGTVLACVLLGIATAGLWLAIGLLYQRSRSAWLPRLGGLVKQSRAVALLMLLCWFVLLAIPLSPSTHIATLLLNGVSQQVGQGIRVIVGLVYVCTLLIIARAWWISFIVRSQRAVQPDHRQIHAAAKERVITVLVLLLLAVVGYGSLLWQTLMADALHSIVVGFPMHQTEMLENPREL